MSISAQDRERISAAIRAAEAKTSGEIVCVLAQTSSDATALPIFIAAVAALALPWLLVAFTAMPVHRILSLQVVVFVVAVGDALPAARAGRADAAAGAPRRRASRRHGAVHDRAASRAKQDRTGILIFVSLAERYARIIADEGIAARVPQSQWQAAVDALIAHMRDGRIADGFVAAIDPCGNELARHFPRTEASRDELPDRIHLI